MKFIWAFLECLIGLAIAGFFFWLAFFALRITPTDVGIPASQVAMAWFLIFAIMVLGVWLVVDAVKRGNRKG